MDRKEITIFLTTKSSYLKWGNKRLADYFSTTIEIIKQVRATLIFNNNRYLVIPDLHMPFEHKEALEFCVDLKRRYDCNKIVFLGDLLDNHFASFHSISTKAKGGSEELSLAKEALKPWYKEFPDAKVCTSNHDSIPERKLEAGSIPKEWLRPINEVLGIHNWEFKDTWDFGTWVAIHGTDGKSIKNKLFKYGGNKSIIQGHFHTGTSIEYYNNDIWGCQLGALIDSKAYAFEYAKNFANCNINSAAVIINGKPIIETL